MLEQRPCLFFAISLLSTHLSAGTICGETGAADGEWHYHGGDRGSSKYSSLGEINARNISSLQIVWRWSSPDTQIMRQTQLVPSVFEATPLMINGVLYVSTSFSMAAAIDGATGKTKWIYDPKSYLSGKPPNNGFVHRGVAYWTDGKDERIFLGTGDANLVALDARAGKPCLDFGENGKIDLTKGLRRPIRRQDYSVPSPPIICRDVVIVGCSISDGPMSREIASR